MHHGSVKKVPALLPFSEAAGNYPHRKSRMLHPLPRRFSAYVLSESQMLRSLLSGIPAHSDPVHSEPVQGFGQSPLFLPELLPVFSDVLLSLRFLPAVPVRGVCSRSHSPQPLAHIQGLLFSVLPPPVSSFWDRASETSD